MSDAKFGLSNAASGCMLVHVVPATTVTFDLSLASLLSNYECILFDVRQST